MPDSETYSGLTKEDATNRAAMYDPKAQVQIIPQDDGLFTLDVTYPDTATASVTLTGKMSWFGGPHDLGVKPGEGLALMNASDVNSAAFSDYFLPQQPANTTGLARRLDPAALYIACRWNYSVTPRNYLRTIKVKFTNPANQISIQAQPVDWGPNDDTSRVADLSPELMKQLGLQTDSKCRVDIPLPVKKSLAPVTVGSSSTSGSNNQGNFYTNAIEGDNRFRSILPVLDLALLEPVTRQLVQNIIADAKAQGASFMTYETYRSQERQAKLFAEGNTKLDKVGVHHYGLACDIVRVVNGKPSWDGDFSLIGKLAYKYGLVWGGDWGNPKKKHDFVDDYHVQRCSVARQNALFSGTWYPDDDYNPYEAGV
jgi:hypothetical protein